MCFLNIRNSKVVPQDKERWSTVAIVFTLIRYVNVNFSYLLYLTLYYLQHVPLL